MDNIPMGLNEYDDSISDSSEESLSTSLLSLSSSQSFTEPFPSLDSIFSRRTFAFLYIDVFSFVLRCFRTGQCVVVNVYL